MFRILPGDIPQNENHPKNKKTETFNVGLILERKPLIYLTAALHELTELYYAKNYKTDCLVEQANLVQL